MPLDTPPQLSTARSHSTHSMTVFERMEAHSPGASPIALRPPATSATASAAWRHVQLRQMPSCFWRIQTLSARMRAAFQNMAGMVSPGTTMSRRGWMWLMSQSPGEVAARALFMASPPGLLFLPAALATHAIILEAEVKLLDVLFLAQALAGVFHD